MFKMIKKYFVNKIQSDELKSDIKKAEGLLAKKRMDNIPFVPSQSDRTEKLIKKIAEQQVSKNSLIDRMDKIPGFVEYAKQNPNIKIEKENLYSERLKNNVEREIVTPESSVDIREYWNLPNLKEDSIVEGLQTTAEQIQNEILSDFDIKHINETPSYVPKAIPKEPVLKVNKKHIDKIYVKKKNNIRTSYQYFIFKLKNIDFSSNIFVWKNNIKKLFNSFKTKYILIPLQKFNKNVEKQIFLSNLTKQQRESLKNMNIDSSNFDANSALVKLVIKKNFDLKALKDSLEKQKKRQKEREEFAERLKIKHQNFFRNNDNHLLFE